MKTYTVGPNWKNPDYMTLADAADGCDDGDELMIDPSQADIDAGLASEEYIKHLEALCCERRELWPNTRKETK